MSNEDGWDRPETFCLYNKEVHFVKVEIPVPDWMTRADYNAAIQVWADMTSGTNALSFFKMLEIWEKIYNRAKVSADAGAPEKALTEGTLPHNWQELIKIIMESSVPNGKETFNLVEAVDWSWLWNAFEKFFEKQGIRERPYDGPIRTVRDNPQA